ncbi:MAG: methyl-accepting chemotaxis protein [Alphaproteobacteria bacterium]
MGLTFRAKILSLAAISLILMTAIGATAYGTITTLTASLEEVGITGSALRNHVEGDMMHDALRADVLSALRAGDKAPDAVKDEVRADLKEHVKTFRDAIAANRGLALDDDVKRALATVEAPLDAYITAAEDMIRLSLTDRAAAEVKFPRFLDSFKELEEKMARLSDTVQKTVEAATVASRDSSAMAKPLILGVGLAAVLASAAMAAWTLVSTIRPLAGCANALQALGRGDTSVAPVVYPVNDEIGTVVRAIEDYRQKSADVQRMQRDQEEQKVRSEAEKRQAMRDLADDFESGVKSAVDQVSASADGIVDLASRMGQKIDTSSARSLDVAETSERTSHSVDTVAAATEELSASIAEISRQVAQSAEIAALAVTDADRTNEEVRGLTEAVEKIGQVVKLITDIASQTNLLALNATIEAARAGDAGKGFAVVASEVKNLANQTARATDEIGAQITAVQGATQRAAEAIGGVSGTIARISEISSVIAAAVEEQGAATQEIARNVRNVSSDAQSVSGSIGDVARSSASSYGSAIQVIWSADDLKRPVDGLKRAVGSFLASVRSA